MKKRFYIYIMASRQNGTLYLGMTSNIQRRVHEHKNHVLSGFTDKYNVSVLVYLEFHETFESAVIREKRLKKWKRGWKLELIEKQNPAWRDLADDPDFPNF
jgi:putative endonuclease